MNLLSRANKYFHSSRKRGVTRGYGLLEYWLALKRARIANKYIKESRKDGRIIDIGCGSYPIFLLSSKFVEKFGIEKIQSLKPSLSRRLKFISHDIESCDKLPFENNFADTVTMLAVLEHIGLQSTVSLMPEIYRVLKPGGICIITMPCPWSEWLLKIFSYIGLVSKIELSDHKRSLNNTEVKSLLKNAKFKQIHMGYFECFMNRYFIARK